MEAKRETAGAASVAPAAGHGAGSTPAAAIAHGGAGSSPAAVDGCRAAVDAALAALERGASPIDAAVAGVVVLEDDERYNAGTGARVRLDGKTVQMDAAVMSSDGKFGAVAVIEEVKNPVRVARAVVDTPHLMLAGDGATRFARAIGFEPYDPTTEQARAASAKVRARLPPSGTAGEFDWRKHWNFERTAEEAGLSAGEVGSDTVGVAVRGADGTFAVALSTGGTTITLRGRVGDVPILGAGLYAGPSGAVAATGTGERIMEAGLGRRVHDWLSEGQDPAEAARRAVDQLVDQGDIGVIVIGADGLFGAAGKEMAWAGRAIGSAEWAGPAPAN